VIGVTGAKPTSRAKPAARCPIRLDESCSLCFPGATGPRDCGLVYLVMHDPELREDLSQLRALHVATHIAPVR
jgi:hypothetical protein